MTKIDEGLRPAEPHRADALMPAWVLSVWKSLREQCEKFSWLLLGLRPAVWVQPIALSS